MIRSLITLTQHLIFSFSDLSDDTMSLLPGSDSLLTGHSPSLPPSIPPVLPPSIPVLLGVVELAELDRVLVQLGVGLENTPFALSARWEEGGKGGEGGRVGRG